MPYYFHHRISPTPSPHLWSFSCYIFNSLTQLYFFSQLPSCNNSNKPRVALRCHIFPTASRTTPPPPRHDIPPSTEIQLYQDQIHHAIHNTASIHTFFYSRSTSELPTLQLFPARSWVAEQLTAYLGLSWGFSNVTGKNINVIFSSSLSFISFRQPRSSFPSSEMPLLLAPLSNSH